MIDLSEYSDLVEDGDEADLLAPSELDSEVDERHPQRVGWWLLVLGLGSFLTWGAVAPLDQGISAPGTVVVSGNHKAVQPLNGGIVKAIHVREGQTVEPGQILVELDTTQAQAELDISTTQWRVAQAVAARLRSERDGREEIVFPPALLGKEVSPEVAAAVSLQRRLFYTRRTGLQSEISIRRENIAGLQAQARSLEEVRAAKQDQIRMLQEELVGLRELTREGFLARNRLSEQERLLSQLMESLSQDIGSLARVRSNIRETNLQIEARRKEYQKEVESLLTDVEKEAASLESRIKSLDFSVQNTQVKAPSEGVVVGMKVHTVGGVVQSGLVLMEIVPLNETLKVDVRVEPHMIDKVKSGLPVEISFPALNIKTTPRIPGQLIHVSADAFMEEATQASYYKALAEVTTEGMGLLKRYEIRPGMPAMVFIRTGERTMLSYLLKPVTDRMHAAFTED